MRPQRVPEQAEPAISQIRYAYECGCGCGTGYGYAYTLPDWVPSFLREFEAKLASAYHEWVKNARRSGKSIYHFSLICLCVCMGVRAWVCACVTGESLAKTLDNTYLHARKTSTNKCGQVPEWEECNAAHSVANALVMQPSRKVLRSIGEGYVMNIYTYNI